MGKKEGSKRAAVDARIAALLEGKTAQKLQELHGAKIIIRASDDMVRSQQIPSGIFGLDYALSGGWPVGCINTIFGPKSGAKTTTILRAIAEAQKLCADCWTLPDEKGKCKCGHFRDVLAGYIDVEGTLDRRWAEKIGVDLDRCLISRPEYAEQSLDIADLMLRDETANIDLLALDSIAFLTPQKEIEESVSKDMMGVAPRVIGKGVRKFVTALNYAGNRRKIRPTIFLTNQIRMKLGMVFGNPETQPGGMAPGFAATTEVRVESGKFLIDEDTRRPVSVGMKFKVDKNKSAVPKIEGTYKLILADTEFKRMGSIYDEDEMVAQAERMGIIERRGGWRCVGEKFSKKEEIEERLVKDRKFYRDLREVMLRAVEGNRDEPTPETEEPAPETPPDM